MGVERAGHRGLVALTRSLDFVGAIARSWRVISKGQLSLVFALEINWGCGAFSL